MSSRLFYCDQHQFPLPPGHKFPVEKYALLRALLAADGFYRLEPAPFADAAAIGRVHDPHYVRAFLSGSLEPRTMRQIGFPWSEQLVHRTLASVGGTLSAAADALATGFGGNLAGGTHHAFRDAGAGFCVFNDLAIAIRAMGRRAAVIDLDVHQGDGTAAIFAADETVFTLSLHGAQNFPFRKQRSRLDVELPDGTPDEAYLDRLRPALAAVREFRPEVLLYQSGVDGLAGDRLGRLSLTHAGLMERDRLVFGLARTAGLPVVVTLGGGYAIPIAASAEAHANTFRAASRVLGI